MDRIIRKPELEKLTGLSQSTIRRRIASGSFPRAVAIGQRAVGWRESEVRAWMDALPTGNLPLVTHLQLARQIKENLESLKAPTKRQR